MTESIQHSSNVKLSKVCAIFKTLRVQTWV